MESVIWYLSYGLRLEGPLGIKGPNQIWIFIQQKRVRKQGSVKTNYHKNQKVKIK